MSSGTNPLTWAYYFHAGGTKTSKVYAPKPTDGSIDSTYARTGQIFRQNQSGVLEAKAANVPQLEWLNSDTLLGQGSWLGYTNLLTYSEQIDNAAWSKTDTTVTANDTTAPDNTVTADLLTQGVAGTASVIETITVTSGASVNASGHFKYGNNQWIVFQISNSTDNTRVWFDLLNGVVGTSTNTGSGVAASNIAIRQTANGFYRCSFVGAVTGATNYNIVVTAVDGDGSVTRVNNATYYMWGMQATQSVTLYPYAQTEASTTTIGATTCVDTSLPTSLTGASEYSIYLKVWMPYNMASTAQTFLTLNTDLGNYIQLLKASTGQISLGVLDGGAAQAAITSGVAFPVGQFVKVKAGIKENDFVLYEATTQIGTDNSGTVPSITSLSLGYRNYSTALQGNCYILEAAVDNVRHSNTDLAGL